jgi:hypothetical protein
MIKTRITNLEAALDQMFPSPEPQQTLCLYGPGRNDLPTRGLENQQTMRKTPVEMVHLPRGHTYRPSQACLYLAPSPIAPWKLRDLSRYYCVSPNDPSEVFDTLADPS